VICGVEFYADGEGCRHYFAGFGEDVQHEACAFLSCATVLIGAEVCLAV
jgi:hypothetical protein